LSNNFSNFISQVQQQRSPITITNESPVRKIEVLSEVLSPEQQKNLITTPVRKVAVLTPVKNENIITKIVSCFLQFYITE
jgi:hypothetical protein